MNFTNRLSAIAALLLAVGLTACSSDAPTTPRVDAGARVANAAANDDGADVVVETRNMYFGASLDPIIAETNPALVPIRAWQAWQRVQHSNPPERIRAMAAEIARERPALVGLQEVAIWRTQAPADNYPGGAGTPATAVTYDFLAQLLDELRALGVKYEAVATVTTLDIEAVTYPPPGLPFALMDVRFTDRNVIIARKGVQVDNAQSGLFAAYLPATVGGAPLAIRRGYAAIDAKLKGVWVRFADTHLEQEMFAFAQEPQGAELRRLMATSPFPVIVVGDLNSAADGSNTRTYASFRSDGYADAWTSSLPGFSCCQAELLDNAVSLANERIDYVLMRGGLASAGAELIGFEPSSRTASGLWPSDHAGVVARVRLRQDVAAEDK